MPLRRSTRFTAVVATVAVASTAAIIAGVVYNGSAVAAEEHSRQSQEASLKRNEQGAISALKTQIASDAKTLDPVVADVRQTVALTAGRADEDVRESLQTAVAPAQEAVASTVKSALAGSGVAEVSHARDTVKTLCADRTKTLEDARVAVENNAAGHDAAKKKAEDDKAAQSAQRAKDEAAARNASQVQPTTTPCPQNASAARPCPYAQSNAQVESAPSASTESNSASVPTATTVDPSESAPSPCPFAHARGASAR